MKHCVVVRYPWSVPILAIGAASSAPFVLETLTSFTGRLFQEEVQN